jgi:hypothetical protein
MSTVKVIKNQINSNPPNKHPQKEQQWENLENFPKLLHILTFRNTRMHLSVDQAKRNISISLIDNEIIHYSFRSAKVN